MAAWDGKGATRTEIVLHIDDDQRISRGVDRNRAHGVSSCITRKVLRALDIAHSRQSVKQSITQQGEKQFQTFRF
jgi:hypothetical protein